MSEIVLFDIRDRIGYITLNRPEKKNALNTELVAALKQALSHAIQSVDCKVIVIEGAGDVFCSGADLEYIQKLQAFSDEENLTDSRHLMDLFLMISQCPKVVISKVQGAALAGGCGLATVSDICIASNTASFGYTEARIGFIPAMVMVFLLRKISGHVARELLLSARIINAEEAVRCNLIHTIVPHDELTDYVHQYAAKIASGTSPQSIAMIKQMVLECMEMPFHDAMNYAAEMNVKARKSDDCKTGIAAFLNKQPLKW